MYVFIFEVIYTLIAHCMYILYKGLKARTCHIVMVCFIYIYICLNITVASTFFSSLTNVRCLWLILVFPTKKIVLVFKCYAWSVSYWSPVCLINNNIIFTFKQVFVRFPEYLGFLVYVSNICWVLHI